MPHKRTWTLLLALALAFGLGRSAIRPLRAAAGPATNSVEASAPLGTLTTVPVTVDNSGQPATTAQLYEALAAPTLSSPAPPAGALRVPLPAEPGPISPDLAAAFAKAPAEPRDMMVYLSAQADLSAAAAVSDWNQRGAAVVAALQQTAAETQGPILASLRQAGFSPTSFWIVNAIEVTGNSALAQTLAAQPGVALVAANVQHQLTPEAAGQTPAGLDEPAWGIARIGVPGVWSDWGVRGAGITVANLDTGVDFTHTALLHQYRGWSSSGVDNNYNWYDPAGDPPVPHPVDGDGHGTHTMGIMVAGAAGGYSGLGVAPDARWIAVRGCEGIFCSDDDLIKGAQWLLAPTDLSGKNPRPDLRPQIINNSWGQSGDDPWYDGYVTAWNAAGMFSSFAIGNNGLFSECQNTITPGNYANSFGVGATDQDDGVADFSSRGPTVDGRLKPDITAPGVNVPSTWPNGGVMLLSGTSMAAPHVAGVAALLWSANPQLIGDIAATERVLTSTAVPLPTAECSGPTARVPNNLYGWGRVDARAAVQQARVDVPWLSLPAAVDLPANGQAQFSLTLDGRQVATPGTYTARVLVTRNHASLTIPVTFTVQPAANTAMLRGRLTDLWQGAGVYGRVLVGSGPAVQGDVAGDYTVTLPYGAYTLTANATGYFSATASLALSGPAAANFILQPDLPHIQLTPTPISATLAFGQKVQVPITITNGGSQPLNVSAVLPPVDWVVSQTGSLAGPLYDLSADKPVSLTDDSIYSQPIALGFDVPIYGMLADHLYLSSNGWVSAVKPSSPEPLSGCLPNNILPPYSLAPFWADLDPGVAGAVRFGHVGADTFVISFERVPAWHETPDPSGPTYTFQLALHSNGNVEFLYGAMGAPPERWSVGASFNGSRGQSLACYRSGSIASNTVWQLRNQPSSNMWLGATGGTVTVPPGKSAVIDAVLSGFGYAPWHTDPFVGILRLLTNDPIQPQVSLSAQANVGAPPYNMALPVVSR